MRLLPSLLSVGPNFTLYLRCFCSFAIFNQQLSDELWDPVCAFYLVLQALDILGSFEEPDFL